MLWRIPALWIHKCIIPLSPVIGITQKELKYFKNIKLISKQKQNNTLMFLLPDNFSKRDFCEGCSFLWLYNSDKDCCILCDSESPNEDIICKQKFSWKEFKYEKYIGYYLETIDATSEKYQMRSSSGWLITSLLEDMLVKKEIDYVICVWWSQEHWDFRYMKIDSIKELISTQRSAYYPISLIHALQILEKNSGTCAITCIPSAAKAIEILKMNNKEIEKKIKYTIGLTYNSTKKREYTEYLCKKAGRVDGMKNAEYISYRDKEIDENSGTFWSFVVKDKLQTWSLASRGTDWSIGLLQEFSSNFIDDHYTECADISVMDGWHKNYIQQKKWTSLAIIRNIKIFNLISKNDELIIHKIDKKIILDSQKSGIRFKNDELGIRLQFYKIFYKLKIKSRIRPRWWKNPILIILTLLRIYISLGTGKVLVKWENIEKYVSFWWKKYQMLYKINNFIFKKYEKISSFLTNNKYRS